jgi:hypothetical protein
MPSAPIHPVRTPSYLPFIHLLSAHSPILRSDRPTYTRLAYALLIIHPPISHLSHPISTLLADAALCSPSGCLPCAQVPIVVVVIPPSALRSLCITIRV